MKVRIEHAMESKNNNTDGQALVKKSNGYVAPTKLWNRDFILMMLSKGFNAFVFYLMTAVLAAFSVDTYGSDALDAGLLVGIFVIGGLVSRFFTARYTEVIGRRKLYVIGLVGFFVTTAVYLLPVSYPVMVLLRFINGFMFGVATGLIVIVVNGTIPAEQTGEGLGYYMLCSTLFSAIGPFIGLALLDAFGYTAAFASCLISAGLSMLCGLPVKVKPADPIPESEKAKEKSGFQISNYIEIAAIPICMCIFFVGFSYYGGQAFVKLYADELGMSDYTSWFFILTAAAMFIARPLMGKVLDRRGSKLVVYPCMIISIVGFACMVAPVHPILFLAGGFLMAFGMAGVSNASLTIAVKCAPEYRLSISTSTYYVFLDTSSGIAPTILGALFFVGGYSGMFAIAGAVLVLTVVWLLIAGKSKHPVLD